MPIIVLCLLFSGLAGVGGSASADIHVSNGDTKKIEAWCKSKLGNKASQLDLGACFEGYVLGLNGKSNGACDNAYKGNKSALHYCKVTGYNGGKNDSAKVKGGGGGQPGGGGGKPTAAGAADQCGGNPSIGVSIDIGCRGQGNPIADMAFAFIRVLSAGVGLVVVGSMVVGGIQYSASRGDPQATAQAVNRIRSSLYALLIYIFGFALLNYIIPGAILR